MGLILVTGPAEEPLTVSEAKEQIRLEVPEDDNVVLRCLSAARQTVEKRLGRMLVTQTWDLFLDEFPCDGVIRVEHVSPVQSVSFVKYLSAAGVYTTLDTTAYTLSTNRYPATLTPAYGTSWPSPIRDVDAVQVRLVLGYGAGRSVPEDMRHAVAMVFAHFYAHRESVVTGTISSEIADGADALIDSARLWTP